MNLPPFLTKTAVWLWAAALLLISACDDSPKAITDNSAQFVISHSAGVLPASAVIRVRLAFSVEEFEFQNQPLPPGILMVSPEVRGNAYLDGGHNLRFVPDVAFKNGAQYKVVVNLQKLYPDNEKPIHPLEFSFQIVDLDFRQNELVLSPYTNTSLEWNRLSGSITTSDVVAPDRLLKWLSAQQGEKVLPVSWEKTSMPPTYRFVIDSVERNKFPSSVKLVWSESETGVNKAPFDFDVPPVNEFNLMSLSIGEYPEQHVLLTFSDPLSPTQNPDGLVYLKDQAKIKLDIDGNTLRVTPESRMTTDQVIVISSSLKNIHGETLGQYIERTVNVEPALPEVKFIGSGSILPGDNQWIVPFEARNLTSVEVSIYKIFADNVLQFLQVNDLNSDYEMYRVGEQVYQGDFALTNAPTENTWDFSTYAIDLTKFISAETGAVYQINLAFSNEDIVYPCTGDYDSPDSYYWQYRDNPCKKAYYNQYNGHFPSKNVLAGNLGVTARNSGNSLLVNVNNLLTTLPVQGCKISVFGFQQQVLGQAVTDAEGRATILVDKKTEPGFLIAEQAGQRAYLKLDDGQALSYSKFNTSGRQKQDGLDGFLFGERGVWRPGDTLFMSLILDDRAGVIPDNHPVSIEFRDTRNKVVQTKTLTSGTQGYYCFTLATSETDAPGLYTVKAMVGNASFTKPVRIENIKPNRLKIELTTADSLLSRSQNKVNIKSMWLSGGAASGFEAICEATFKPMKTRFENYPDYHFDCPSRTFYPETQTVFKGLLDDAGETEFTLQFPSGSNAPGMIGVSLFTKVLEKGGDFSVNQTNRIYSPFSGYVGIKLPEIPKGSDFLEVDTPLVFNLITVDEKGKPVWGKELDISVYKLTWSWWYSNDRHNNLGAYIRSHYDERVLSSTVKTSRESDSFSLNLEYPAWGWYYAEVADSESGHATGIRFYVDWPSYYSRDQREMPGDISQLSLSPDKSAYQVGDTVNLTLDVPDQARLLVSLESNDTVIKSWSLEPSQREAVISFSATKSMVPNIYASVSVIQPYHQAKNDLPIRMYGVADIRVNNPEALLKPVIDVAETIRPNTSYNLEVSEKNGREMVYSVAVVDDGLLDLTNYKTPDPYSYFNAKEALDVRIWDDYGQILGAFGGRILHTLEVGGDGSEEDTEISEKKANRFKPVVSFLGPFTLKPGEKARHTLAMPNYVGSVRAMVVAAENKAYGSAQQTITVKQPLMVLATVPRVLSPDETIYMPVTVFAMDDKIRSVKVKVITNDFLEASIGSTAVEFSKAGEKLVWIPVKVGEKQGVATIKVETISGNEKASYEVEVQVRNPNSAITVSESHVLTPGQEADFTPPVIGEPDSRSATMTVSGVLPINLESRIQYLNRYPYGCTEQVVSGVFPQLYLHYFLELNRRQKESISRQVMQAINELIRRQLYSGGMTYWPGGYYNDWVTSYAGHFLISAMQQGYTVPAKTMENWVSFQTKAANEWTPFQTQTRFQSDGAQAYRLYTLALAQKPALSAMNRLAENTNISEAARVHLSAAYAVIGQRDIAHHLISGSSDKYSSWHHHYNDFYGSITRDQAFSLITYMALGEKEKSYVYYKQLAETLGSGKWLSTQSTAFALLAVSSFVGDQPLDAPIKYSYSQGEFKSGNKMQNSQMTIDTLDAGSNKSVKVTNLSEKDLFLTFTGSGIPAASDKIQTEENLKLRLSYFDMNNKAINPDTLTVGMDFYVKATVTKSRDFSNDEVMALSYKTPAGWEIINTNMFDAGAGLKSSPSDFKEIGDAGVDLFFPLRGNETKVFYVLLHASFAGEYVFPVSTCEAMYNNEVKAASGGGWIKVKQPGKN